MKRIVFFFIFLLPSLCFGAPSGTFPTSYNISTLGPNGGGYDYEATAGGDITTALTNWEDATDDIDMVTAQKGEGLLIYGDGSTKTTYTLTSGIDVALNTGTDSASYFRFICVATADQHDGTASQGIEISGSGITEYYLLAMTDDYGQLNGLVGTASFNNTVTSSAIFRLAGTNTIGSNLIAHGATQSSTGWGTGFSVQNGATLINSLSYENEDAGVLFGGQSSSALNVTSIDNTGYAFRAYSATSVTYYARNCIANGGTAFSVGGSAVIDSSTTCTTSGSVSYVDAANDDYHLQSGDTIAKDNGTTPSGWAIDYDDDGDYGTRSGSWDIGFDEQGASGALQGFFALSGTLKEKEGDASGAAYQYLLLDATNHAVYAHGTAASDGTWSKDVPIGTDEYCGILVDNIGGWNMQYDFATATTDGSGNWSITDAGFSDGETVWAFFVDPDKVYKTIAEEFTANASNAISGIHQENGSPASGTLVYAADFGTSTGTYNPKPIFDFATGGNP